MESVDEGQDLFLFTRVNDERQKGKIRGAFSGMHRALD